jgi:hypothetical protein
METTREPLPGGVGRPPDAIFIGGNRRGECRDDGGPADVLGAAPFCLPENGATSPLAALRCLAGGDAGITGQFLGHTQRLLRGNLIHNLIRLAVDVLDRKML